MDDDKLLLKFGWIGAIVLVLAIVASYVAFRKDEEKHTHMTSEVPATITSVEARRGVNPKSGLGYIADIMVSYQYSIGDKAYARTVKLWVPDANFYKAGDPAKVCYDPLKEEEAELFPARHKCGE